MTNIPNQPDCKKEHLAHLNLDYTKNLNDQGYYGPFPNDADPRTTWKDRPARTENEQEYYDWVEKWVADHNGVFDNKQMDDDRRKELMRRRRERGETGPYFTYW